jgi:adenylate cyclase
MLTLLDELHQRWRAEGKPLLRIGIGLNTGIAAVGNMGSSLRYGYTALGDTVNLASRLEGLNKLYGTRILVSESAYAAVSPSDLLFRELDLIRVKGKSQPVTIYELMALRDGCGELAERVEVFHGSLVAYKRRDWRQAHHLFEQFLARWPGDGPGRVFLRRCEEFLREEPAPDWDGVYLLTTK